MPAPNTARLRPLPDTTGWTDTDHQIASLLGRRHLSSRLTPTQLVLNEGEDHVPPALRPRVRALRALVESRFGRSAPIARQLLSSVDVARYFRDTIGHHPLESSWLLTCDSRNQLRTTHRVGSGGASSCPVRVDQILRLALLEAASAIIVVHNHPSGDPTPSPEDIELTSRLREAADAVGLRLLDHVIVSVSGATSFLDLGLMTHEAHRG